MSGEIGMTVSDVAIDVIEAVAREHPRRGQGPQAREEEIQPAAPQDDDVIPGSESPRAKDGVTKNKKGKKAKKGTRAQARSDEGNNEWKEHHWRFLEGWVVVRKSNKEMTFAWLFLGTLFAVCMGISLINHLGACLALKENITYHEGVEKFLGGKPVLISVVSLAFVVFTQVVILVGGNIGVDLGFRYIWMSLICRIIFEYGQVWAVIEACKSLGTDTVPLCWFYVSSGAWMFCISRVFLKTYDFLIPAFLFEVALNASQASNLTFNSKEFLPCLIIGCFLFYVIKNCIDFKVWEWRKRSCDILSPRVIVV